MTVGSLFSGIGGLELGLEMAGPFTTLWQAERDPYASAVLAKHWPHATRFADVRDVTAQSVPRVDVLCGGFPCQPHSYSGQRRASDDERDLWPEFARVISETQPRWVVAENVPGLLTSRDPIRGRDYRGAFFGRVLADLAGLGFDAEWHSIPAAAVGAPHLRYRVFIVAYAAGCRRTEGQRAAWGEGGHAPSVGRAGRGIERAEHEFDQPGISRIADGVPARVERNQCLGNAVVPQVAAVIGRAIWEAEECRRLTGALPAQIVTRRHLGEAA